MQAIELIVRRTKGSVSYAASAPHVNLKHTPRFMVRVRCRSTLRASIERTFQRQRRALWPAAAI